MSAPLAGIPAHIPLIKEPARLAGFAREHLPLPAEAPAAIAKPTTPEQVSDLLRWASEARCPVVPVSSSAGPRRHGDTAPPKDGLVVDLSGMDRLIHVDNKDNIAVIEPGMTFSKFDELLRPHGLRSLKPLLPRRSKSVIASYLDREPITSAVDHWDSDDPMGGTEMVFGTGDRFRSGGAAMRGSLEEQLAKGARQLLSFGPSVTDFLRVTMGSQGTLAIMVWSAVYCEPIPAREKAFFLTSNQLDPVTEVLQRVLLRRNSGQQFIVNKTQLALMLAADKAAFDSMMQSLPEWIGYVNLTALDYLPDERMAYLQADLRADAAALGVSVAENLGNCAAATIGAMQNQLSERYYKDRLFGAHRDVFVLTQRDKADALLASLNGVVPGTQPLGVYLQPRVQGVNCHLEVTLPFDPADANAVAQSEQSANQIAERLAKAGGYFSRPHGNWTRHCVPQGNELASFLKQAKNMFDPAGILNPGRNGIFGIGAK